MCDKVCNSIHELSVHHQQSHKILYCNVCTSGQQPSLISPSFPFESTLKSHHVSHCTLATHFCLHANCSKKFKNKGDLTRHIKKHSGTLHECPDSDYKNPDIRNWESHRIKHSNIEKYLCKLCEKKVQV